MEKLFTLIKKVGIEKADLDQFVKQVQDNTISVIQYIEPKVESGLEIIRRESNIMFEEVMKDLKPLNEVAEDNKKFKPINDVCFQDFLEFHGITWNRYKLLSGKYNQKQVHEFIGNTNAQNWLNLSFPWTTEEGTIFWETLHYQWKEYCVYAINKDIQIIFNREENESSEYFIKVENIEETKEQNPLVLNFKQFLQENNIDTIYFKTLVLEDEFGKLSTLKDTECQNWISSAFNWTLNDRTLNFWNDLDNLWRNKVALARQNNIDIEFGYYIKSDTLSFKTFLEENRINVSEFKQWTINDIGNLKTLKLSAPGDWINDAFDWSLTTGNFQFWEKLDTKWKEEVERAEELNHEIVFNLKEEKLNFKKFLKQFNKDKTFKKEMKNGNYSFLALKEFESWEWIDEAFSWDDTKDDFDVWSDLNTKWITEVNNAKDKNIKVVFGFKV